ncbi:porin family protein [Tenacibaculum sp.]|uniref:porin family protein n=1 Tax=Tenacibaculum sp. TaxID=1906242 RepID=UPI003D0A7C1C
MKKLLVIVMIALGFTANAQEIHFGVKAGVNFANLYGNDLDNDTRTSFHVGGVLEIELSDKFSLQPELIYSAQGAKRTMRFFGLPNIDYTTKVDYLNIPIMAKYYIIEGLSLEAGPQIGINILSEEKGESNGMSETSDLDVKSFDFGLNFGAGYKLENGLNFGVRYNLGLTDIPDGGNAEVKNGVFQLSVGYFF